MFSRLNRLNCALIQLKSNKRIPRQRDGWRQSGSNRYNRYGPSTKRHHLLQTITDGHRLKRIYIYRYNIIYAIYTKTPFSFVPTTLYDRSYIILDKTFEKGGMPSRGPAKAAGQLQYDATRTNICTARCITEGMYSCYYNSIIESLGTNIKRIG